MPPPPGQGHKHDVRPFVDKWHLVPGDPFQQSLEKALEQSTTCAVFLGPEGMGPWEEQEMRAALDQRVKAGNTRVIPVLLPGATQPESKLPAFLRGATWVDFRGGLDDDAAFASLVAGILGKQPGRNPLQLLPRTSLHARKRVRDFMIAQLKQTQIDLGDVWRTETATLRLLERRCQLRYPQAWDLRDQLAGARSRAYGEKYALRTDAEDERHANFAEWEAELSGLLRHIGISEAGSARVINVGIGNGTERPSIYQSFAELVGVDIAEEILTQARTRLPNLRPVITPAEDLATIPSASYDLYISLRAFQSTLFDVEEALFQAWRVLAPGGRCLVSISDAHTSDHGLVRGILQGAGLEPDLNLPYLITDKIRRALSYDFGFREIGVRTGLYEVYVYGRKPN
ncbi:MAG TPA: TIR domain-containing protein [Polyangiaceae bacterium]|nr:TIR domain-containing protein [Polyangiaceae bacterium]